MAEGPDALSDVCLLAVDSINDLHNVPLDTESPHAAGASPADCLPPTAKAASSPSTENAPSPLYSPCGLICLIIAVVFFMLVITLNICLILFILFQNESRDKVLHSLAERLDAQTQIMRQMAATHHFQGNNSSEI